MSRPFFPRSSPSASSFVKVNGKIRAREVRVIGIDGQQLGVLSLGEAINMARQHGVDLVEIAPNAAPPVCRLVDFGKFRYEQAKKEKEAKKHQHANKVKEIQLSPTIDPHDFVVKLNHAIEFLCDEMKVKVTLRFRGREMAHKEFGFQQVEKFVKDLTPYGHPDAPPKLIGRGINVMLSPLPRNKRAKNPKQDENAAQRNAPSLRPQGANNGPPHTTTNTGPAQPASVKPKEGARHVPTNAAEQPAESFGHNPFAQLDIKVGQ
ncbi:MAG: translation initiation factor IF-3 [Verrucomicrobia bacterium]|nr:translation initiation factor IF-3 [Verrucomicrobiota bacterium]